MARASPLPPLMDTAARPTRSLSIPVWLTWLTAGAIFFVYVASIGFFGLSEPDEARYGEIPREMLQRGDWLTPHLNYVKYFEKPPLLYWLVASTYAVFGFSEFLARLWPVSFALLGMAATYLAGRTMWNEWVARVAVALLAASPLYFGMSQVLSLDMPLTGLISLAAASFWLAFAQVERRRLYVVLFYVALALAVLTKGPVAIVLLGGIVTAFVVLRWEWDILRWLLAPPALLIFVAIAAPWHLLVSLHNPEFFQFYIVEEHLKRYLTPAEHHEPWWFFLPIVLGGAAPWTVLCLARPDLLRAYAGRVLRRRSSVAVLYCTLWAGIVLLFFSLSGSKLATYIVPMFPPLALLMARWFEVLLQQPTPLLRRAAAAVVICGAIMLLGGLAVPDFVDDRNGSVIASRLLIGGIALLLNGAIAVRFARQSQDVPALATLVIAVLSVQLVVFSGRSLAPCYKPLGLAIRAQATPDDLVMSYHHLTQGIPLYAEQRMVLVGVRGEIDFGSRQGDHSAYFWDSDDELVARWSAARRIFMVISRNELEGLAPRLKPAPRTIAGHGKKVVVVNFAE